MGWNEKVKRWWGNSYRSRWAAIIRVSQTLLECWRIRRDCRLRHQINHILYRNSETKYCKFPYSEQYYSLDSSRSCTLTSSICMSFRLHKKNGGCNRQISSIPYARMGTYDCNKAYPWWKGTRTICNHWKLYARVYREAYSHEQRTQSWWFYNPGMLLNKQSWCYNNQWYGFNRWNVWRTIHNEWEFLGCFLFWSW